MLDQPSNAMNVDPLDPPHAPPPSALLPTPAKKRRVTISGTPHPLNLNLNTDIRIPPGDQTNSTPISPVVIGLSIQRDDPAALEQVRSMLSVKQKQKALIEQRRGSVAGILSTTITLPTAAAAAGTGTSTAPLDPISDERLPTTVKPPHALRPPRRSPNPSATTPSAAASRRSQHPQQQHQTLHLTPHPPGPAAHLGPPDPLVLSQPAHPQISHPVPSTATKSNPLPPPISFARRRAGQFGAGKKKPADIVISPRESHTREQLQPAIQSAPPVLLAGQQLQLQQQQQHQFLAQQFPMALPRLPSIGMGPGPDGHSGGVANLAGRRPIAGQVPPTPSRFSLQRNNNNSSAHHPPTSNLALPQVVTPPTNTFGARSPPASVAIATSLVPPTPTSLHQPTYTGDKSAFLAPFSLFYDALNDSKQLKNWLGEQLHKSNAMLQSLATQQEKMDELVDTLVDRKMVAVREEMGLLHRRVEELEDALRVARSEMITRRQSVEMVPATAPPLALTTTTTTTTTGPASIGRASGKQPLVRNGSTDVYTFPPVQPLRKASPPPPTTGGTSASSGPGWRSERERESQGSLPGSEGSSPAPYNTRRLSISAMRLDPPRTQQVDPPPSSSSASSQSFGLHSPPPTLSLSQQQQQAFRDGLVRHSHGHGPSASPRGKSGSLSVNSTPVMSYRSGGGGHSAAAMGEHRSGSPMDDD